MTTGWLVGVFIEVEGEPAPQRRFFVVAQADQGRAEWSAIDQAMIDGPVVTSPVDGLEPVQAIRAISAPALKSAALAPGAVKPLGARLPRRWLGVS